MNFISGLTTEFAINVVVTLGVYAAFVYSIVIGVKAVRTMDNHRTMPRCAAILMITIGVLYVSQGLIRFSQGEGIVIYPLSAIVSVLSVAVNLIAIQIFIKESTNDCAKGQCILK